MTSADRGLAARYHAGDVVQYTKGSKEMGLERGSYATVLSVDARENTVTVRGSKGQTVTYDPARLKGVNVYGETRWEIAAGDRIQFTAPDKELGIRDRDLATVEKIAANNSLSLRLDSGKTVELNPAKASHIDHGYVVDGAKAVSADRVLVSIDGPAQVHRESVVYKVIDRATWDATLYTSDRPSLQQAAPPLLAELPSDRTELQQAASAIHRPGRLEFEPTERIPTWEEHDLRWALIHQGTTGS